MNDKQHTNGKKIDWLALTDYFALAALLGTVLCVITMCTLGEQQ